MSSTPGHTPTPPSERGGGCLRAFLYGSLGLLFLILAAGAFVVVAGLRTVNSTIVDPVSAAVKQLAIEATPIIVPDPVTIIREINQLSRLETASYGMERIVTAERDNERLFGILGERLIFVAVGEVIAGVDLALMETSDMVVYDQTTVAVHLPPAEIFVATLDNDLSYVYDRERGLLGSFDAELETQVRQSAEAAILDAALERGILQEAENNAEAYMETLLRGLGFETITFTDETPAPAPPRDSAPPKGFQTTP